MQELSYAERERETLNSVNDGNPTLYYATDILQYHIIQGLAVTSGSALGYSAPDREKCWTLFLEPTAKADWKQAVQMHQGGKAFTKHSHRASSGWSVSSHLEDLCRL